MMVGRWGMSKRIGPVQVLPEEGDPRIAGVSEGMLDAVAEEVRVLVDQCHERALTLLEENRWRLDSLAERVLEKETLDELEIYQAAGIRRSPGPTEQDENQRVHQPAQTDTK